MITSPNKYPQCDTRDDTGNGGLGPLRILLKVPQQKSQWKPKPVTAINPETMTLSSVFSCLPAVEEAGASKEGTVEEARGEFPGGKSAPGGPRWPQQQPRKKW